ncbi:CAH1 anhydrase, partial [Aegotheles bennettii]|nr:CAH1 anhydrase [Aegotheles bennettii]
GPDDWQKFYPIANGHCQSPVDIKTKEVKKDASLGLLQIICKPSTCKEIVGVGYSFHVNFEDKDNQSVLTRGPLTGKYRLQQFHFHWGQTNEQGSEHAVDGRKFAPESLITQGPTIIVTGAPQSHKHADHCKVFFFLAFQKQQIRRKPRKINEEKEAKKLSNPFSDFDPSSLFPKSLDYWTRNGFLTHPPLHESVIWTLLKKPITINSEQLAQFCTVLSSVEGETPCPIPSNHRQPQTLKGRVERG